MHLESEDITAIVDFIDDGDYQKAVSLWQRSSEAADHCNTCFYTPMPEQVRCFACLEGHLTSAVLSHAYPHIPHEDLELIDHMFKTWTQSTIFTKK